MKATWSMVLANHRSSVEQPTLIGRFVCPHIFKGLIGKFRRFVRMLIMLCLKLALFKIESISTMQIARLAVFFS
jgi:hypothetical protein